MMLVDCQTCPVRDVHCADCMVTALTAIPMRPGTPGLRTDHDHAGPWPRRHSRPGAGSDSAEPAEVVTATLDRAERRAVSAFLAAGLVTTATANAARAELDPVEQVSRHGDRRAV